MIEMSLTELAVAVLAGAAVLVIFFSWVMSWTTSKKEKRSIQSRVVCRLCLAVFDATGRDAEQTCPECGAKTGRQGPTPLG